MQKDKKKKECFSQSYLAVALRIDWMGQSMKDVQH